ncbi:MAG: tetratricopeptide repeat protein [Nannocystaceae bacterium]
MSHDEPNRPYLSGPDDETRSLMGVAKDAVLSRGGSRRDESARPGSSDDGSDGESMVGERIGRFIVLGTVGRGGMGTVYEAFDRTLDRRVAVKVLHEYVDSEHQKRLIHEAQALAQLSHPNVVQVYEAGETGHRSFIAMELVQGSTLRRWLEHQPRPDWRACVEIYLEAGAGLAAAHEQGLVHCDFKPSNAIVDDKGRVRVLDFGLARVAQGPEPSSATSVTGSRLAIGSSSLEAGTVMGTPSYMPPEQLEAEEIDARGDQYSFCVALFEAVYDERPFEGQTLDELISERRAERIVAVPRSSKVPAELGEILARGLAADPERRWPSMQVLLDRLRSVVAPRRRRRTVLAMTGALAVGGVLAGLGLAHQAQVGQRCSGARSQLDGVWDAERRQQLEAAILATGLSYAPDTWERVSVSLQEYADAWVTMHTETCEATSVRQEQSAAVMDLRMGCLRDHRVALREAVNVLLEAEPTRVEQAVTLVGSLPPSSRCEDVEALRSELPPPEDPAVAEQVEALRDRLVQVRSLRSAGVYDEASAEADAIVARADELEHPPLQAEARLERGDVLREQARFEAAERDLESAYLLATELGHLGVASAAVRELAFVVGQDQAQHEAGLQWGKTAVALARRPRADAGEEAMALSAVGMILLSMGELGDALEHQRRALEVFEGTLGSRSVDIADLLHNMGTVLLRQGKQDEALGHLRRALSIRREALGPGHPHVADTLTSIGAVMIQQGEWEPALERLEQALAIRQQALGARHPDVATALNNVGAVLKQQGQLERALDHYERALDIQQEVLGPQHPRVAYPLNNLGELLRQQGKLDEARVHLQRALEISKQALGPDHPDVASSATNLGNLLLRQKRYDEAEQLYRRALEIQQGALPADHPHISSSLLGLAKISLSREEYETAREAAERAVTIREGAQMPPELVAEARFVLARALENASAERSRARALAEQARKSWMDAGAEDSQTTDYLAEVEQWLAEHPLP